ncbi:MAG: 50S ribosomal protein L9 [Planctomycetota bacterium]
MNILLLEDVPKLGKRGEIVKVRDGYARNFLIPRKLGTVVDSSNAKMLENERAKIEIQNRKRRALHQMLAENLQKVELEFVERAHDGILYGSISVGAIVEKLASHGFKLEPKQIMLEENIKSVGTHSIPVKLKDGIQASLTVHVIAGE